MNEKGDSHQILSRSDALKSWLARGAIAVVAWAGPAIAGLAADAVQAEDGSAPLMLDAGGWPLSISWLSGWKAGNPETAFWDLGDRINRLHDAHESIVSRAMLAEVPLAGLTFLPERLSSLERHADVRRDHRRARTLHARAARHRWRARSAGHPQKNGQSPSR
jgi:hypothetical protein